jgi:MprA protease rhombosortase-interaction domain-containing protein
MSGELAYLIFGAMLCVALLAIGLFAYARRRKERVEAPKYKMLEDDD